MSGEAHVVSIARVPGAARVPCQRCGHAGFVYNVTYSGSQIIYSRFHCSRCDGDTTVSVEPADEADEADEADDFTRRFAEEWARVLDGDFMEPRFDAAKAMERLTHDASDAFRYQYLHTNGHIGHKSEDPSEYDVYARLDVDTVSLLGTVPLPAIRDRLRSRYPRRRSVADARQRAIERRMRRR